MLKKIHNRLISFVVGKKPVVMNVDLTNNGVLIKSHNSFIARCNIVGTK